MRKLIAFCLILLAVTACEKESYLRLKAHKDSSRMLPNYNTKRQFRSTTDTISLKQISSETYYTREAFSREVGSIGSFDKLELEHRKLVVGSDTPYVRISYLLESLYEENSPTSSRDELEVSLQDDQQDNLARLRLGFLDSLHCVSPNCLFADTLALDSVNYYNVYYLAADSTSPVLYINQAQGVVGFRTSENKFYQRIK